MGIPCTDGFCGASRGAIIVLGHASFGTRYAQNARLLRNAVTSSPETGTIDVVLYDEHADSRLLSVPAQMEETLRTTPGRRMNFTRSSSAASLGAALTPDVDVFVVFPQSFSPTAEVERSAAIMEGELLRFLRRGGVVVVAGWSRGWRIVDRPSLLEIDMVEMSTTGIYVPRDAVTHPVTMGVGPHRVSAHVFLSVVPLGAIDVQNLVVTSRGPAGFVARF